METDSQHISVITSLVKLTAMGYLEDKHLSLTIVNSITDPPIADTNASDALFAFHLQAAVWAGIAGERQNGRNDSVL